MRSKLGVAGLALLAALNVCAQPDPGIQSSDPDQPADVDQPVDIPSSNSITRAANWREDIDFMAGMLSSKHKDFYKLIGRETFAHTIEELKRDVPRLSDSDIIFRLSRVVASLGVAHTNVKVKSGIGAGAVHVYPLQMRWFSDELAVVAAAPEYRQALGCRVVRMGSLPPLRVEPIVAPYISHENEAHLRHLSSGYMMMAELMQSLKLAEPSGHLQLTCANANGKEFTLDLAPLNRRERDRELLDVADTFHIPTTLAGKNPRAIYWFDYLPDSQTLYIQYNQCHEDPKNPHWQFMRQIFTVADSRPVQRLVVDLRFNAGGSTSVILPLVQSLKSRPALTARGHFYVLIGDRTYSAGLDVAVKLRKNFQAILVGQPAGMKPNHYGEAPSFNLPHSKLRVQFATKYFRLIDGSDPKSLEPDIPVPRSIEDFLAGRDRVMETVVRLPPRSNQPAAAR